MTPRLSKQHLHTSSPRPVLLAGLQRVIDAYATGAYPGIVADLEAARRDLARRPVALADKRNRRVRAG